MGIDWIDDVLVSDVVLRSRPDVYLQYENIWNFHEDCDEETITDFSDPVLFSVNICSFFVKNVFLSYGSVNDDVVQTIQTDHQHQGCRVSKEDCDCPSLT